MDGPSSRRKTSPPPLRSTNERSRLVDKLLVNEANAFAYQAMADRLTRLPLFLGALELSNDDDDDADDDDDDYYNMLMMIMYQIFIKHA